MLIEVSLMVKFKYAVESQPTAFVVVYVYIPGAALTTPFQIYVGVFEHTATFVVLVDVAFVVNNKVATESQPALFVVVNV